MIDVSCFKSRKYCTSHEKVTRILLNSKKTSFLLPLLVFIMPRVRTKQRLIVNRIRVDYEIASFANLIAIFGKKYFVIVKS